VQHHLARLNPIVHEGALQGGNDRSFDSIVRVSPVVGILRIVSPLIRDPARKTYAAVDDQQLAAGAMVDAAKAHEVDLVIAFNLHARVFHPLKSLGVDLFTAEPVEQHVHFDPDPAALGERIRNFLPNLSGSVDEPLESNRALRASYRVQHGRENLITVAQRRHLIVLRKRAGQQVRHDAGELIVGDGVEVLNPALNSLLSFRELAHDEVGDQGRHGHERDDDRDNEPARHKGQYNL
jgi:hypothetical protein